MRLIRGTWICIALLVLGGCQRGLVWKAAAIRTPRLGLWGNEYYVHEAWIEAGAQGATLCVNYYDLFGGPEEQRFIFRRYQLKDGALIEELKPGRKQAPVSPPGDYAAGYPTREVNPVQGSRPPQGCNYFARDADGGIEIVEVGSQKVVDRVPGTKVGEQDGKGDVLVVSFEKKPDWRWRGYTYCYDHGARVAMLEDEYSQNQMVRGGAEPIVVRWDGTNKDKSSWVWLGMGQKQSAVEGRAIVAYDRWLVTGFTDIYVWDIAALRAGQGGR